MTRKHQILSFTGIAVNQFISMLIMCGVGVYGYAVSVQYDQAENLSILIALETVARCITIPFSGTLSEYVGKKKLYCFSTIAYIGFYTAAAFTDNFWAFVIMRMMTGAAWGLFTANALTLMTSIFSLDEAPKYSGYLQTISTAAMAVGGPLAGIICGKNWRLEFYILLPVMAAGTFLVIAYFNTGQKTAVSLTVKTKKTERKTGADWNLLFQNKYFIYMLLLTFLYNIANATGNYLAAYAQSELHISVFWSSLITTPGILIAIVITTLIGIIISKTRKYKKMVIMWVIFSCLGFGSWWFCSPLRLGMAGNYLILMSGYMIAGIATAISQIIPYTYSMHYMAEDAVSKGVSLIGWSGAFGTVIANSICSIFSNAEWGLGEILKIAVVPSVLMIFIAVRYRDIQ